MDERDYYEDIGNRTYKFYIPLTWMFVSIYKAIKLYFERRNDGRS